MRRGQGWVACVVGMLAGVAWAQPEVRTAAGHEARTVMTQAASRVAPPKRAAKKTPRAKGPAIARRASRLVGVASLTKISRRVPDDCSGLVRLAAEPEGVQLTDGNARVSDNAVTAMYRRARAAGAFHKRRPRPGDLVFFRETYDRNRDGARNDGLTHVGVVEKVSRDGTVTFVHRSSRGVTRARMNVRLPRDKARNDYLRRAQGGDRAYLTGELFSGYATPERLRAAR